MKRVQIGMGNTLAPEPRREKLNYYGQAPVSGHFAQGKPPQGVGYPKPPATTLSVHSQQPGVPKPPLNYANVEHRLDAFTAEEQRLEEAYRRLRERRQKAFLQELADFELNYNPFEVLGLHQPTDDVKLIKKAYRKQSLRFHPDKNGGNEDDFALVTKAYCYIMRKLEKLSYKVASQHELKQQALSSYEEQAPRQNAELDSVGGADFSVDKFNRVYDEHRLSDFADDGYADFMSSEEPADTTQLPSGAVTRRNVPCKDIFNGKFNRELFMQAFEDEKKADEGKELIIYEEPEPLMSCNVGYAELGADKIKDFGQSSTLQNKFTDYKRAHTTASKLIDPATVQTQHFASVEDLKSSRSRVSHTLSPADQKKIQLRKRREELDEEERLMRLQQADATAFSHFNKVNKLMLSR